MSLLPKYTAADMVVFIDGRERGSDGNEDLIQKIPYRRDDRYPFEWRKATTLDVGDVLICVRVKKAALLALKLDTRTKRERELEADVARLRALLSAKNPLPSVAPIAESPPVDEQTGNVIDEDGDDDEIEEIEEDDEDDNARIPLPLDQVAVPDYWIYDPVAEHCKYVRTARDTELERDHVYVPLAIIERKKDTDLSASINGKKNQPDFYRFKDQKMRMQGFDYATGARCGVFIEEYIQHCNNRYIGRLPEDSFNSAVVHTAWRSKFIVDHTVNIHDTERHINKLCRDMVEQQFTNVVFPHLFQLAAQCLAEGTVERREVDEDRYKAGVQEHVIERVRRTRELFDGVIAAEKLGQDHTSAIAIRKKDNRDPAMCYLMQLQSFQGVGSKAKFIARTYSTMHDLVHAYDAVGDDERKRERLLASIETDTLTKGKNPKKRKLGPALSAYVYHTSMGRKVRIGKGAKVTIINDKDDNNGGGGGGGDDDDDDDDAQAAANEEDEQIVEPPAGAEEVQ